MKSVASLLIVTVPFLPIHAYANGNEAANVGRDAQTFANELSASFKSNQGGVSNGNISFPTIQNGQFQSGGGTINVNDLFPGTSSSNNDPSSYYFPDGNPNISELEGVYNSNDAMDTLGGNAKTSLWNDANSGTPTISGSAYKVLLDASNQSKPDFKNDPIMNLSKSTYDDIDLIAQGFGDCSAETVIKDKTIKSHVPDYYTCDRLYKPTGNCTITHTIEIAAEPADIVFLIDNSGSMGGVIHDLRNNVGAFAQLLTQDGSGDLRLGGAVYRNSDYTFNRVELTPDFNTFKSWLDGVSTAGAPTYPFDAIAWAANHYQWRGGDIRKVLVLVGNDDTGGNKSAAISALASNQVELFSFHNNGDVKSIGTPLADYFSGPLLLKFAQNLTVVSDRWTPQSCIEDGIASLEEFCSGSYTASPANDNTCVMLSGFQVCKGDPVYNLLGEPPLPNVPKLAARVDVSQLECSFNQGQGTCWIDKDGNEQCLENYQDVDQCKKYEDNPQCGFISSQCVDGATGSQGNCYVHEEKYDCGYDVDVPSFDKETEYSCGGPIKCMGDDCLDINKTQSTDFARASALLNAAQFMTQDMSCEDITGENNTYCKAFSGDEGECKIAVGGAQDCCEKPSGLSMGDYLTLMMSVPKLDGAIMALDSGSAIKGAYQAIRDPAISGWTEITKPFTSYMENITGAIDNFTKPITDLAKEAIQALKDEIAKITGKALGNASATGSAGVPAGASEGMMEQMVGQQAASILSGIMAAYTAYVVAMMIIQIVWKCEEEEFELNAKRALNSCHQVGSYCKTKVLGACIEKRQTYCCFSSPLSKIIQQQIRPQLGLSWGSAKAPQCDGIPLNRLAEIDWEQVNLDEWLGLLQANGKFPESSAIDLDSLTGAGSVFNTDGTRLNAADRAQERLKGVDLDAVRKDAGDSLLLDKGAPGN
ncbi:conjugal transfer mating pair stabilization protein TraN [Vibrio parahaemolyticus]|uniref:conjugal transfer mating pair stabilization protein TraN n=1 Tax=Vibrio parahaemolyticus TaxID=670 RepID=UPI00215BF319|nr:conjugal transfer mating pair stabilization protein TraN [Vibrio parahaemolyticus]MCR9657961.1 conjugal transfer mating pair stabilization protein TraN [Vibrio parahaemolyticus]MCZ5869480.1 conjugal transfer mating pair stabilization protein TraN [Vibrio parahaemolyticus]MCZ5899851.1 conjugal transfer mating pair stabilization protein TraN [Vibrio parahaemolyticus]MCZ6308138.1 conjugal transfer mating pair stabilization protein TraN [Vibrio parahaemolyticus]